MARVVLRNCAAAKMEQEGALMREGELPSSYRSDFDNLEPTTSEVELSVVSPTGSGLDELINNVAGLELPVLPYEHISFSQSLPELAGELVMAQCSQNAEVEQREEEVAIIRRELQQEKEQLKSAEKEICNCSKAVCLAQGDLSSKMEECFQLRKEISLLVSECHNLKLELKKVKENAQNKKNMYKEHRTTMKRHATRVRELEKTLPLQKELECLESFTRETKAQRIRYMEGDGLKVLKGEKQKMIQDRIIIVKESIMKQKKDNHELEEKIKNGRDRIQKINRELEMSKKRHTAQMTRLQRQVTEAQSRQRQWLEEMITIKQAIQKLRQKIEE